MASAVLVAAAAPASAQSPGDGGGGEGPAFVPGELIVGYAPRADAGERREVRREEGLERDGSLPLPNVEKVEVDPRASLLRAARELEARPEVAYAQPNYYREPAEEPQGDELYAEQAALREASAPAAWDISKGGEQVVVAVVDDGVDIAHPDLDGNIWANPGESGAAATDGQDSDSNGYEDDVNGWDFTSNRPPGSEDCSEIGDGDVASDKGHGTHVAGIVGADQGDGGTVGVSWEVGLMPVKIFDSGYLNASGNYATTDFDIACAFLYARDNGAGVINASIGGNGDAAPVLRDVIDVSRDVLFVVAAGNGELVDNVRVGLNVDTEGNEQFLCNLPNANLVCVAASDGNRIRATSNYGPESVDLAAPGSNVLSTDSGIGFSEDFEGEVFPLLPAPGEDWTTEGNGVPWGREQGSDGDFGIADSPTPTPEVDTPYAIGANSHATSPSIPLDRRRGCSVEYGIELDLAPPDATATEADRVLVELVGAAGTPLTYDHDDNTEGTTETLRIPDDFLRQNGEVQVRFSLVDNGDAAFADGVHIDDVQVLCTHAFRSGTSMAAPHVAGAAALGLARAPDASPLGLKRALLNGVDPLDDDGAPRPTATDGRLNASATLQLLDPAIVPDTTLVNGPKARSADDSPTFSFESGLPTALFECRIGSTASFEPCESGHRVEGLPDGRHVFEVRAISPAGTPDGSPARQEFTVDTAGPRLRLPGRVSTSGRREQNVRVTVRCVDALAPPCRGRLRLRTAGRVDIGRGRARRHSLGTRDFVVRRGATATVTFRMKRAMADYVQDRGRLRLRANAAAVDSVGNYSVERRSIRLRES